MSRFVAAVALATAGSATAHANVEVGGTVGLHVFSENNGIGVDDGPDADSQRNTALFGLRLGVYFGAALGVELEAGGIPGEARSMLFDVANLVVRGSVVYQRRAADPNNLVLPFAILGAGVHSIVNSGNTDVIAKDTTAVPHLGGGVKYRADNGWGVRAEARLLLPPSSASGGVTADFEALVSVYREYGRTPPTPKQEPPPTKVDDDPDRDGVVGAADQCPAEPEDKDGFQDDDGCPDPDNDGDGVADAADQCPLEPEAKNGFQDADGCPDQIPDQLKQFTGVIQGINFKVSSADLAPGSTKPLDAAVAVLAEFTDTKLEIQGHTDDQPLAKTAKYADNTALSQARAETVKAYFVSKGIDDQRLIAKGYGDTAPVEDPKPLKGVKLTAARAKNRRVEFRLITDGGAEPAPVVAPPP